MITTYEIDKERARAAAFNLAKDLGRTLALMNGEDNDYMINGNEILRSVSASEVEIRAKVNYFVAGKVTSGSPILILEVMLLKPELLGNMHQDGPVGFIRDLQRVLKNAERGLCGQAKKCFEPYKVEVNLRVLV